MFLFRSMAIGIILSVLGVSSVEATPQYLFFEGDVSGFDSTATESYLGSTYGLSSGAILSYTVLIDRDLTGSFLLSDGSTAYYADFSNSIGSYDFFYADLINATFLTGIGGDDNYQEANRGESSDYNSGRRDITLDLNNSLHFYSNLGSSFSIGQIFNVSEGSANSFYYGDVTLKNICDTNDCSGQQISVPEPATIALMGLGLFGLRFSLRKKTA
jgi:hypothetical protein